MITEAAKIRKVDMSAPCIPRSPDQSSNGYEFQVKSFDATGGSREGSVHGSLPITKPE